MKVKFTCNSGSNDYPTVTFTDGDERDVDADFGKLVLSRGHAVEITPPPVAAPVAAPVVAEAVEAKEPAPAEPDKSKDKFQRMRGK